MVRNGTLVFALFAALLLAGAGRVLAADTDGDGMSDAAEAALGTDPKVAEQFVTLLERKVPEKVADKARFVAAVALANAGGNRFVWRMEMGADFPKESSNLMLYLDADADANTGRQGHGCEGMPRIYAGEAGNTVYNPAGQTVVAGALPRVFVDGRLAYLSYDVDLKQDAGKSHFRLNILSETLEPHRGVDSIPYFAAQGPAVGTRPKLKLDEDISASEGIEQTYGPLFVDPLVVAKENVRLPIFACELQGFKFTPSEYRADNVTRTGMPARRM